MNKKIVVGMSGGVDSSITLFLLKQAGWDPIGVSLKLAHWKNKDNCLENACCTDESLLTAKEICKKLNVPYYTYNVKKEFQKEVIDYFIKELKNNRTPNPCTVCNRKLKFKKLFEWAKKHGIKYVATGHYADTKFNKKTNQYELIKAKDQTKDQTYGLAHLPQSYIKNIVLPLGKYTKKQVYKIAKKAGFDVYSKRKQSQDLCFVSSKALPLFLNAKIGKKPGNIVTDKGKIVGEHPGLHYYTIGQRKGLKLNTKHYVKEQRGKTNELIITDRKETIGGKKVILKPFHFISGKTPDKKLKIEAKVRYSQPLAKGVLEVKGKTLEINFKKNQDYIAPGQFCVFYQGKTCLGCGVIN